MASTNSTVRSREPAPAAADAALRDEMDRVVRLVHEATGTDEGWAGALAAMACLLDASFIALGRHDFSANRGEHLLESPASPRLRATYALHYAGRNPFFQASNEYRPQRVMLADELIRPDDLARTDYFREFLEPNNLIQQIWGVLDRSGDVVHFVVACRGRGVPPFGGRDKQLLTGILGHFSLALRNHWALLQAKSLGAMLQPLVARLPYVILVVDRRARLLWSNADAAGLLAGVEGLTLRDGRVVANAQVENLALLEAVSNVAKAGHGGAGDDARVVSISHGRRTHPIMVSVRPVPEMFAPGEGRYHGAAMLLIKTPERLADSKYCSFAPMFELTPAQARLAQLVLSGYSLRSASRKLGVSENTIRSHLKQIYLKTGTHGQMDLVHLHARVCPDHL